MQNAIPETYAIIQSNSLVNEIRLSLGILFNIVKQI